MLRAFVLAASLLAAAAPTAHAGEAESWWLATLQDADRDGIDDALARKLAAGAPADEHVVLLAYAAVPTQAQREAVLAAGVPIVAAYRHFDVLAVRARGADVERLIELPGVVLVEDNDVVVPLLKDSVPLIGAPEVWRVPGATGRGVVVAVLDDGAFEKHPDLDDRVVASYDAAVASSAGPFSAPAATPVMPAGEDGHGTHVAGTILGPGTESGGRYRGVAPGAGFVDVKVFRGPNQTSSDLVLRGLDWTLEERDRLGIRIACMSLGGRPSDGRDALSRAVNVAVDAGLLVVAAAGNAGPDEGTVSSPGAAEKALTVGAVDKQKRIATYSSRGPTLDGRPKPDLVAPGTAITSTVPPFSAPIARGLLGGSREVYYGALSGTSMAAPHVAGVAALVLEVDPSLGPAQAKRLLLATAQDLREPGRDNHTGYGFVNAIAAVGLAADPTLMDHPSFAAILDALPDPAPEGLLARAQVGIERAMRSEGGITGAALLLAGAIIAVAALRPRRP